MILLLQYAKYLEYSMSKHLIAFFILTAFLINACGDGADAIKRRKLIVIARHYPIYLSCGLPLELALDASVFDDALAVEREGDVRCSDYGRKENSHTLGQMCFVRDYHADTNDTCVIGVNYTDYADDMVDLIVGEANQTQK